MRYVRRGPVSFCRRKVRDGYCHVCPVLLNEFSEGWSPGNGRRWRTLLVFCTDFFFQPRDWSATCRVDKQQPLRLLTIVPHTITQPCSHTATPSHSQPDQSDTSAEGTSIDGIFREAAGMLIWKCTTRKMCHAGSGLDTTGDDTDKTARGESSERGEIVFVARRKDGGQIKEAYVKTALNAWFSFQFEVVDMSVRGG